MKRVVIIGIGAQGKKYAKMISDNLVMGMSLVGVCVRSEDTMLWCKENLPNIKVYRNEEELYKDSEAFDIVIITTPHKLHIDSALKAFKYNKAVICEKPLTTNIADSKRMIKAAGNLPFAVVFHMRAMEQYIWIKNKIDSGELGSVKRILLQSSRYFRTKTYHNSSSWRSTIAGEGGGALINQGQHLLDMWQWLFGMPSSIHASIEVAKYNDFDVEDEATLLMKYEDKTGVFIISTGEPCGNDVLEIVGTRGRITSIDKNITFTKYEDSCDYINNSKYTNGENIKHSIEKIEFNNDENPYITLFSNFIKHIEDGEELIADGRTGINAITLCEEGYKFR